MHRLILWRIDQFKANGVDAVDEIKFCPLLVDRTKFRPKINKTLVFASLVFTVDCASARR